MSYAKRVLLIEDHDDSRCFLSRMLVHNGFQVNDYDSCAAAERHLETGDIDIALLDVRLPGRSGDDFGKELRRRHPYVQIVFHTADPVFGALLDAVPDCFVVQKPINIHSLLELLTCFDRKDE